MIIILEGPDGAGKSTLAEKISKQTGYRLLHRSQPKTEDDKRLMMEEYMRVIESGENCVFDRAWYSEMVYGPIMRNESIISYPDMYRLERMLAHRGALIIYCTSTVDKLWRRCTQRGEDYIMDNNTLENICSKYITLMYDIPHLIPVVSYEYEDM